MHKLAVLLFLLPSTLWASPAFVQCQQNTGNATTAVTVTISTTGGNFLIVSSKESTDATTTWSVATNVPQTLTQTVSGYSSNVSAGGRTDIRYQANATAATSVTTTFSGTVSTVTVIACEFSGIATSSPEDTSVNSNTNSFVSSLTSGTFTTSTANDVLLYCVGSDGSVGTSFTAGSGYTIPANGSSGVRHACQYQIVSSTQASQTTNMTWTSNTDRAESIFVAFKGVSVVLLPSHRPLTF